MTSNTHHRVRGKKLVRQEQDNGMAHEDNNGADKEQQKLFMKMVCQAEHDIGISLDRVKLSSDRYSDSRNYERVNNDPTRKLLASTLVQCRRNYGDNYEYFSEFDRKARDLLSTLLRAHNSGIDRNTGERFDLNAFIAHRPNKTGAAYVAKKCAPYFEDPAMSAYEFCSNKLKIGNLVSPEQQALLYRAPPPSETRDRRHRQSKSHVNGGRSPF